MFGLNYQFFWWGESEPSHAFGKTSVTIFLSIACRKKERLDDKLEIKFDSFQVLSAVLRMCIKVRHPALVGAHQVEHFEKPSDYFSVFINF